MNLKQLEAFVKVAEGGSFSKAAKALYLTQPTISAHISSLEKELNVRLFVRNTKEVSLSEDGNLSVCIPDGGTGEEDRGNVFSRCT